MENGCRQKINDVIILCDNTSKELIAQLQNSSNENVCDNYSSIDFKETISLINTLTSKSKELKDRHECCVHKLEDEYLKERESLKKKKKEKESIYQKNVLMLSETKEENEKRLKEKNIVLEEITNKQGENLIAKKQLQSKEAHIKFKEADSYVRDKATFALLSGLINLKWNYSLSDEEVLKGCIASKNDLKPFCIDLKMHERSYVANYLWDLIELS